MEARNATVPPEISYDNIRQLFRESDDPVLTASDVADHFGVSNQAANYRLKRLYGDGDLDRKQVGGAAVVYWLDD